MQPAVSQAGKKHTNRSHIDQMGGRREGHRREDEARKKIIGQLGRDEEDAIRREK